MQLLKTYRCPKFVCGKVLEFLNGWFLKDGKTEDDSERKIEDAGEPPALVGGVHPDSGEGGLKLHVTSSSGIIKIGCSQQYLHNHGN